MSDNFYDDFQINSRKNTKEIKFSLVESISCGDCCIYCASLGPRCTLHNGSKIFNIPKPALDAIRNPSKILGENIIEENNLKFGGKRLHFNTCIFNYAHDSCKNCREGRFEEIKYKDITLKFCFPMLKNNTNVIPIGFHWTFNMTCKNNEIIDLEVFPFDKVSYTHRHTSEKNYIKDTEGKFNDDSFPNMNNTKSSNLSKDNIWNNFSPKNIEDNQIQDEQIKDENISKKDIIKNDSLNYGSEKKQKEIDLLIKENKAQKEAITGLKAIISLDSDLSNSKDLEDKINQLNEIISDNEKNYKRKLKNLNDDINMYNTNIKNLNYKIRDLENSDKFSEKDFKNIKDGVKNFSNILFDSFVKSYNNSDF